MAYSEGEAPTMLEATFCNSTSHSRTSQTLERQGPCRWSDCDQVFCTDHLAYSLTPNLKTICLGNDTDILGAIKSGRSPRKLNRFIRETLKYIIKSRPGIFLKLREESISKPLRHRGKRLMIDSGAAGSISARSGGRSRG